MHFIGGAWLAYRCQCEALADRTVNDGCIDRYLPRFCTLIDPRSRHFTANLDHIIVNFIVFVQYFSDDIYPITFSNGRKI